MAPLNRPVHPVETLGVCLGVVVVLLFCLVWLKGCAERREFVATCLDNRGTPVHTQSGANRCER